MSDDQQLPPADMVLRWAMSYLAQRAAASQHLRGVIERRIRKKMASEAGASPNEAIARLLDDMLERVNHAGLLDDAGYAASRARALERKGLPAWRIRRDLEDRGLDASLGMPEPPEAEIQARRFAERKRLGRFRATPRPELFERDVLALIRAGFPHRVARTVLATEEPDGSMNLG